MKIRRRLAIAFVLLFAAGAAHASTACTYTTNGCVQYADATQVTGATSFTLSSVGANHEIVFMIQLYPADTYTVASSLGLTYTKRLSTELMTYCACYLDAWTAETGSSTGNETVTITPTGSTSITGPGEGLEYQGFLASAPYDASNSYVTPSGQGTGSYSTGSVVTSAGGDVMVSFAGSPDQSAGVIFTADTTDGFHKTAPDYSLGGNTVLAAEDNTLGAAGTYVGTWGVASGGWVGWIHALAFKAIATGTKATQTGGFLIGP